MTNTEKMLNLLARIVLANESELDRHTAIGELKSMLNEPNAVPGRDDIEHEIDKLLLEVGVPCHLIGHEYVKKAIALSVGTPSIRYYITTKIYPQVADESDQKTTPSRVERGIRHAIESAWNRGDTDVLCKYFGNTVSADRGKPTNAEFICTMAQEIQHRMNV